MRSGSAIPPRVLNLTVQIRIPPRAPLRGILPQLAPLPYLSPQLNYPRPPRPLTVTPTRRPTHHCIPRNADSRVRVET